MKCITAISVLLTLFAQLCAQTPEDLVRDVKANSLSVAALKSVIEKHAASKDAQYWSYYDDTIGFFQQKKLFQSFKYRAPSGKKDSITRVVNLFITYTNDQVRYIKLESFHYAYGNVMHGMFRPVYYIDSAYTAGLLSTYNSKYKTNFTPADLYEDECNCFCVIPKGGYKIKPGGGYTDSVEISYELGEFWVMIKDRDHAVIVKNCRSFNTTRKAYGAFCLYVLQRQAEPLSWEEKELMQQILNSTEKINYRAVCKLTPDVEIKNVLTPEELKDLSSYLYGGK
jgi:hypothetical protein